MKIQRMANKNNCTLITWIIINISLWFFFMQVLAFKTFAITIEYFGRSKLKYALWTLRSKLNIFVVVWFRTSNFSFKFPKRNAIQIKVIRNILMDLCLYDFFHIRTIYIVSDRLPILFQRIQRWNYVNPEPEETSGNLTASSGMRPKTRADIFIILALIRTALKIERSAMKNIEICMNLHRKAARISKDKVNMEIQCKYTEISVRKPMRT